MRGQRSAHDRVIGESKMRGLFALPIVATFALALNAGTPAHAFGARHAFCLTGDEWPGLSNCTFDTYAQCRASSSGRALTCIANPLVAGESDDPYAYQNRPRPQTPGYSWSR
jgi:hypothetical protein